MELRRDCKQELLFCPGVEISSIKLTVIKITLGGLSMRRKDREMSREFGIEIIDKSQYGLVSMIDNDNLPYGIPLSIVRVEDLLYFHSAKEGKKVNIFEKNPEVSIAFVGQPIVPDIYSDEELDEIVKDQSKIMLLASNVFTTYFESAIVTGKVRLVEDEEERIKGMRSICEKYTPTKMKYFEAAMESGSSRTNVYSVEIKNISAKRKES